MSTISPLLLRARNSPTPVVTGLARHAASLPNSRQLDTHNVALPSSEQSRTPTTTGMGLAFADAAAEHRAHSRTAAESATTDHEHRLQLRLRANGRRCLQLRRVSDPLVRHLFRVAGNPSYRSSTQSVIVSGGSLVKDLRKFFHCKRLITSLGRRNRASERQAGPRRELEAPMQAGRDSFTEKSDDRVSVAPAAEMHYASDRILRKLAGLHSYDGGCVAEMAHPPPAKDLGDIRLLLCLGRPPCCYNEGIQAFPARTARDGGSQADHIVSGLIGTLLRSAAALQWQGVWLLPQCPDVFSPLAIRASQGALFWMPYCRGTWEELLKFSADHKLLVCVPHGRGRSIESIEIAPEESKGICLVIDEDAYRAAGDAVRHGNHVQPKCGPVAASLAAGRPADEDVALALAGSRLPGFFRPDLVVSLPGAGVEDEKHGGMETMAMMHPVSWSTIMMYQLKQVHFPDVASSAFVFSLPNKGSSSGR
ncbi:family rna methyltransferase [Cystoisospora suis]|uniref:Family rna methyltransferase n=1 Tax=Cystoisospora suis TaxID=483139 RepID=A0A2C6LD46_9APIC|nr:family rna methyltransferase [Cystoisospora suis]